VSEVPVVHMSRREIIRGLAAGSVFVTAAGCTYNQELGRSQLLFVPESQMAQLAASAWQDQKAQQKLSRDPRYTSRMNRVAQRLLVAAGENPAAWEWQVFEDDQLNAFALPGNKMGFYTGILDIMETDDQVAVVAGHEIGHVKYRHGAERFSQSSLAQTGLAVGQVALGASELGGMEQQIAALVGVSAVQLGVLLPFSRKHELEADRYGVRLMNSAGYDARQSITFWERMAAQKTGGGPPEIFSTHPADATRIAQLRREVALLPPSRAA